MSATEQPSLDPEEMKSFTSRKMDWLNGVSIDPDMTPHDFQVAFCIAQCMSIERGVGIIADDTIAQSTGTSRRHVLESRKRLRDRGWLKWVNTRTANVYTLSHDLVGAMIDLRTDLRDRRAEARFDRLPSRRLTKAVPAIEQHVVNPSAQQECPPVNPSAQHVAQSSSQHVVNPSAQQECPPVNPSAQHVAQSSSQHVVNPSAHIHLHCSTQDIHLQKKELPEEDLEVRKEGIEPEKITVALFDEADLRDGANQHTPNGGPSSQYAMVAAKLAKLPAHRPAADKSANLPTSDVSQPAAATMLNVSERSVRTAKTVRKFADQEQVAADLSAAADIPPDNPLPAIQHEQLAEMRLIDELGEGDPNRGVVVAERIGDARFEYLRRELMRGTLLPSAIRAARSSVRIGEAA